jgi:hypothetical protein
MTEEQKNFESKKNMTKSMVNNVKTTVRYYTI